MILLLPEILICFLILVLMGLSTREGTTDRVFARITIAGLSLVAVWLIGSAPEHTGRAFGLFLQDSLALYFKIFFVLTALLVSWMAHESGLAKGEYYALILFAALGMMLLVSAADFLFLYVALELITVSFYVLTSYFRKEGKSLEAGIKYLILSSLASGLLVYGICYIYGSTGSTDFREIRAFVDAHSALPPRLLFGFALLVAGFGFKISAVPFQLWAPDVYEGAPTPVTAFLAVGSKAAGFAALLRVLYQVFWTRHDVWILWISCLAAMNLLYGNLGAMPQKNLKRLLAYSSIGHAGYLLMGVASGTPLGVSGVVFYLLAYLFTILAAFLVIVVVSKATGGDDIADFNGLSQRAPFLAAVLFVALLSSAGVPPLAGFFGKFLIFMAAVKSGLLTLAGLGAAMVVVALYYYLLIIKAMYMEKPRDTTPVPVSPGTRWVLLLCTGAILIMGVFQGPFVSLAVAAVRNLF